MQTKTVNTALRNKEQTAFNRKISNAKRKFTKDGDLIPHFVDFDEIKALSLSHNEKKIAIAGACIPLFDDGIQSKSGLCTYYNWSENEVAKFLDWIFVRGVQILLNEDLSKGTEEHALLGMFASDLFDQYCLNGYQDADYLRWGLATRALKDKTFNPANKRIIDAFKKLNP